MPLRRWRSHERDATPKGDAQHGFGLYRPCTGASLSVDRVGPKWFRTYRRRTDARFVLPHASPLRQRLRANWCESLSHDAVSAQISGIPMSATTNRPTYARDAGFSKARLAN